MGNSNTKHYTENKRYKIFYNRCNDSIKPILEGIVNYYWRDGYDIKFENPPYGQIEVRKYDDHNRLYRLIRFEPRIDSLQLWLPNYKVERVEFFRKFLEQRNLPIAVKVGNEEVINKFFVVGINAWTIIFEDSYYFNKMMDLEFFNKYEDYYEEYGTPKLKIRCKNTSQNFQY